MHSLYTIAASAGVTVLRGNLAPWGLRGYYDNEQHTIWLHERLNPILERCTLAHELGHAHYGDIANGERLHHLKIEQRADFFAARLLISFEDFKDAELTTSGSVYDISRALHVTTDIVEAYQQQLLRIGAHIYLGSRYGTYTYKERA